MVGLNKDHGRMNLREDKAMLYDMAHRLKRAPLVVAKKSDVFKSREH